MLKRTPGLVLLLFLSLYFIQRAQAQEKIKIGIILTDGQTHYQAGLNGALEQLRIGGFGEDKAEFDIRNAEGNKDKAAEIARDFKSKGVSLIMPIGTTATSGTINEIKDIPVIFSMVFDPVSTGIAKSWESSGNNTTGTSTWVNMDSLVRLLRKICPGKRIGVIYTETEKQTVTQLKELSKLQKKMGFTVVPVNLSQAQDAADITNSLVLEQVDSIFITGSTVVSKGLTEILQVAKTAKIITVAHLLERAEKGVLLVVAANSFQLGKLAGAKAIQVLRGIKPVYIPIEPLEQYDIVINKKTADEIKLKVPNSVLEILTKVIQ